MPDTKIPEGPASGGMQQGRNHTNRPDETEAKRGQGPKTRAANKKIINEEPGYGAADG